MAEQPIKVAIITVSDRSSRGEREDASGPAIKEMMEAAGHEIVSEEVIPDEQYEIEERLSRIGDHHLADLVLTTGGTGFGPRDLTPEATRAIIEREAPGLAEAMRAASLAKTPHAMLSRAVAGIYGETLIVNLPGSPKAVRENLEVILPALPHAVGLIRGEATD